jgi:hypothetical protein
MRSEMPRAIKVTGSKMRVGTAHQRTWWSSEGGPSSPTLIVLACVNNGVPSQRIDISSPKSCSLTHERFRTRPVPAEGAGVPTMAMRSVFATPAVGSPYSSDPCVRCGSSGGVCWPSAPMAFFIAKLIDIHGAFGVPGTREDWPRSADSCPNSGPSCRFRWLACIITADIKRLVAFYEMVTARGNECGT